MSVAGIVQTLCAMPVCPATGKNSVSEAGDSRRFAASPADIVDWATQRRFMAQHLIWRWRSLPAGSGMASRFVRALL